MSYDFARIFVNSDSVKWAYGSNCCPCVPHKEVDNSINLSTADAVVISFEALDDLVFWKEDAASDEFDCSSYTDIIPDWLSNMLDEAFVVPMTSCPTSMDSIWNILDNITKDKLLDVYNRLYTVSATE